MPYTIAVAGKGGTGKTTISGLIIYHLVKSGKTPVFAVDADPNSNLDIIIGMKSETTAAELREDVLSRNVPEGMTKTAFMELKLQECIEEGSGVDLLVMGRPEGPGCYCAVNNLLRTYLSNVSKNYRYMVMDNEAGMEHLSRRTTNDIDLLVIVTTPTFVGVRSALNVRNTAEQLKLKITKTVLVLNQAAKEPAGELLAELKKHGMEPEGIIPADELLAGQAEKGGDVFSVAGESKASSAVKELLLKTGALK